MSTKSISNFFDEQGYVLKPSVFSSAEIENLRKDVYHQYALDESQGLSFQLQNTSSKARYAKGCLLSKKKLRDILLDERVLQFAREILETDRLVYFGDSSYQIGTGLRGFHRDCIDRAYNSGPDWQSKYTLIRLGLYLQNHSTYSGGLKVKPGTHERADGPSIFIDNQLGDLVAWSLKLQHSGNAVKLKWFPSFTIDNQGIEKRIPAFLKREEQQERISLFMTFAAESAHVDRYIEEYELKQTATVEHLKASVYDEATLQLAKNRGVDVRVLFPSDQLKR
ncbi:MAG: phytanoyl-CoA dioxygenase family protein [Flavobacteriales bacterium]